MFLIKLVNCVSVGKSFMGEFFGRIVGLERVCFILQFNCFFRLLKCGLFERCVGFGRIGFVEIFGRLFGRFLGLERIGFIRHICCVLREEGTKNFFSVREEEQEK